MEPSKGNEMEGGTGEESEKTGKEVERCAWNCISCAQSVTILGRRDRFEEPGGINRSEGERGMH